MNNNTKTPSKRHTLVLNTIHDLGLNNPRLVGSVARNEDTENSDIDILVEGEYKSIMALVRSERELGETLGNKVEIIVENEIHKHILDHMLKDAEKIGEQQ